MHTTSLRPKITVSGDGRGIVAHAGGMLLTGTLRVTGLGKRPVAGAGAAGGA